MSSDRRWSPIHNERNSRIDRAFAVAVVIMVIAMITMIVCGL